MRKTTPASGSPIDRRKVLSGALAVPASVAGLFAVPRVSRALPAQGDEDDPLADFPRTAQRRVYDTVLHAHGDLDKLKVLVEATPTLANAAIDWGFGDWETAIGAAGHMGRGDIAEFLIGHGARPDLFSHAMLGHLDTVEAIVKARPGIQRERGPHGITLLAHARSGGEVASRVVSFLEKLGDADLEQKDEPGMLDNEAYLGQFRYGKGEADAVTIQDVRGRIAAVIGDSFPFRLYHLGNHVFHPNGAPSMHFTFGVARGTANRLSIADSSMRIDAERI